MKLSPVQRAYLLAEQRLRAIAEAVEAQAAPLGQQLDAGELTEDQWADGYATLEEALGWNAAFEGREEARSALLAWGLEQARSLWGQHARLFPGRSLAEVESLFSNPRAHRRLAQFCLQLEVAA